MPKFRVFRHWIDFHTANLTIRGIGVNESMPPSFVNRPDGTGDFLLMLFHDAVQLRVGAALKHVAAGTLMLWRPGAGHVYGNTAARWSHSWIHCDGPAVVKMVKAAKLIAERPRPLGNPTRLLAGLLDLHDDLTGEFTGAAAPDPIIVRNTLENVFREAARAQERRGPPPIPPAMAQAKLRIDTEYHLPLRLADLAEAAAMSERHFCTRFGRFFGISPMAYLAQRRLSSAAALLRGSDIGVAEAARQVGHEDVFHFSKQFKKQFGVSPSALRRPAAISRKRAARR